MKRSLQDQEMFVNLPPGIIQELESKNSKHKKASKKLSVIKATYPRLLKDLDAPSVKAHIRPNPYLLKDIFWNLQEKLSRKNFEIQRTHAEISFEKELKKTTTRSFYPSLWIGGYCVDFFLPNLRSQFKFKSPQKVSRGLAIEIDGGCHNRDSKMRKDERKDTELAKIGILTSRVQNIDFKQPTVNLLLKEISSLPTLGSRERSRMWTRIYVYTLAIHLKEEDFFQIFKQKPKTVGGRRV